MFVDNINAYLQPQIYLIHFIIPKSQVVLYSTKLTFL